MASPFADIGAILLGLVEGITHNILFLAFLGLVAYFIIIKWSKSKEVNHAEVIFDKEFECTSEQLKLDSPKKLFLVPIAYTAEEARKNPASQFQLNYVGEIIGVNFVGVRTNIKTIAKLSKQFKEKELKDFIEENTEAIKNDNVWIVFAAVTTLKSRFFGIFPKVKKALIYIKPNQLIYHDKRDDKILVRGIGLEQQGYYTLVTDEMPNLNLQQLKLDKSEVMFDEISLSMVSKIGTYVEHASQLDSDFRKKILEESIKVQNQPVSQEVKT
jgi:hypothetical protein